MSSCGAEIYGGTPLGHTDDADAIGMYVHIPFCQSRCLYCDFHTTANLRVPWETYLEALTAELQLLEDTPFAHRSLETLFVGGGTPTVFPPAFFDRLLQDVFLVFPPAVDVEITVECNPGTVSPETLEALHAIGVNRLSLGVQSFHDRHLRTLTRIHDRETALEAVHAAARAGFSNLSADLIWGIPGQSLQDWIADLETLAALPVTHCATYGLTVYEGTRLARHVSRGRLELPDDDVLVALFQATETVLENAGFSRYEISNWSRNQPCRHNLRYWEGRDWLGLGSGAQAYASSFALHPSCHPPTSATRLQFDDAPYGGHWWGHRDIHRYVSNCLEHRSPYAGGEVLTRQQAMTETLITQLRRQRGLDLDAFSKRFGPGPSKEVIARSETLAGLIESTHHALRLTRKGLLLADRIILELSEAADIGLAQDTSA